MGAGAPWDLEWLVGSGAPLVQKIRRNRLCLGAGLFPPALPLGHTGLLSPAQTLLSKGTPKTLLRFPPNIPITFSPPPGTCAVGHKPQELGNPPPPRRDSAELKSR